MKLRDSKVQVLDFDAGEKYLGRKVGFLDFHGCGLTHRIAAGRGASAQYREELCGKHYFLNDRVKLFDVVVTSKVLAIVLLGLSSVVWRRSRAQFEGEC